LLSRLFGTVIMFTFYTSIFNRIAQKFSLIKTVTLLQVAT
jgi:hypothetical protein